MALLEATAAADKSTFADLALISTQLQRKEFDSALTAAERLQKKQPNQALAFQLKGRILALRKDNAGARASLEHALSVDPAYLPAFQGLAELDIAEKQPRAAIQRYEALLAREPRNHYAMVALARLRQITGVSPEDVAKLLMAAVSAGPGEESPRLLLVDLRLKQRDFKGAKGAAQEAVSALPNSLVLQDALGRALLDGGETQQAVNIFRKLVVALPNDSQPYLRLADAYVSAKDFTAASQSLRRALETSPRLLTAQTGLVRLALTGRRFDEALGIARSVQKERPSEAAGWILEADVHVTQRRPDLAIESMRTALSRETTAESVRALHALYIVTRRLADAEALATKRLRDQPSDLDFVAYLGAIAQERQDYVAAETYFRRVLATKADDPLALNNLAFALVQQRKPEALKFAERAQSLAPDSATVMDTLASALASEEKTALALEWQRKAVSKAPDDPLFRLNLAKLLIKSGDRTEARGLLEGLAWLGPKFSGQSEVAVMLSKL